MNLNEARKIAGLQPVDEGAFVGSTKPVQGPFTKAEAVKACKALIEEGTSFHVTIHPASAKPEFAGKIYVSPK